MTNPENVRHIVFFSLHNDVSDALQAQAISALRELGEHTKDVLEWRVEPSLDTRKGLLIVENSLYVSRSALEAARLSERHKQAAQFMSNISDWKIADYLE